MASKTRSANCLGDTRKVRVGSTELDCTVAIEMTHSHDRHEEIVLDLALGESRTHASYIDHSAHQVVDDVTQECSGQRAHELGLEDSSDVLAISLFSLEGILSFASPWSADAPSNATARGYHPVRADLHHIEP